MNPESVLSDVKINYVAVGVAAVVTIVIGALWYSPLLFGGLWAKAHGFSEERLKEMAGRSFVVYLF